ncbi:MAG TPA: NAD(P)-binding protein [Candidatus Paceibacterota bacterium]|nr:NAD(P)-binding protein [Candidatus Pacearchaeota archaeon]HRZ51227.1 NAD(P)-binding protein [Candidatus Paceibacterota bacterium]HSA36949.1 NAD(P)-binding protein [Candidatus Paceibacterota bacterium]
MKVAILGGGVCGLYLASKLAKSGIETEVFEKNSLIGKNCCSGLFSERLFDYIPESRELVKNVISQCFIHFPKKTFRLAFKKKFYVIDHAKLDQMMARIAQKDTAVITLGKKIDQNAIDGLNQKFDRIIGCDGALSAARNYLKLKKPGYNLGIQAFVDQRDETDYVETWATNGGFIWKIPRGENQEYGIMEHPDRARGLFDGFVSKKGLITMDLKSALIPNGFALPDNKRITLCGDASGLTKPWSGGGVIWGLAQARILLKNFPDFLKYKNRADYCFIPEIAVSKIAKKIVYTAGFSVPNLLPINYRIDGDFILPAIFRFNR